MSQAPSIPSISYRPSADCAYSMLVSKIKGKPIELGRRSPEVKKEEEPKEAVVEEPLIPVPDSELQTVVDKIAAYVAKNGPDFESVVRSKGTVKDLNIICMESKFALFHQVILVLCSLTPTTNSTLTIVRGRSISQMNSSQTRIPKSNLVSIIFAVYFKINCFQNTKLICKQIKKYYFTNFILAISLHFTQ
jgi:Surp module